MSNKFNLVRRPKKTDDDILDEDELDLEDENKSSGSNDFLRKRMISFMLIVFGVMCLLLLVLFLLSVTSHHKYTYSEVEKILKDAAVSYFKEHPEHLPLDEGSIVEIDSTNLVNADKMKPLSEYLGEDTLCSGTVQVEKSDTEYLYTPYLNCGEQYTTVELYRKVLEKETVVTSGYGLYKVGNSYVYRGEIVNNYVMLDESLWRIVKITSDDTMYLISEEGLPYTEPWDNRYNEERLYESGINNYSASRVREFLSKVYTNPSKDDGETILSSKDKARMLSYNLCVGKRSAASEVNDNSEECKDVLKNQKMGLLTLSDYVFASVDPNCKSASTKSCKNYNYLVKNFDWWLVTGNKDDTSTVFRVGQNGVAEADTCANYAVVRPVILINSKTLFKGGKGTLEKPYTVR